MGHSVNPLTVVIHELVAVFLLQRPTFKEISRHYRRQWSIFALQSKNRDKL